MTVPSRTSTRSDPSPSTRARPSDADRSAGPDPWVTALPVPVGSVRSAGDRTALCRRLGRERRGAGVEGREEPRQLHGRRRRCAGAGRRATRCWRCRRGRSSRSSRDRRTGRVPRSRPGSPVRGRRSPGDQQADRAPPFALLAHRVPGDDRAAAGQEGGDDLQQLVAVDRAAVQFEVHRRRAPRSGSTCRGSRRTRDARRRSLVVA